MMRLTGPVGYRTRTAALLCGSVSSGCLRRVLKGPRLPGWNWYVELSTRVLKAELVTAFALQDVRKARRYLDTVMVSSPALLRLKRTPVEREKFRGSWFTPGGAKPDLTMLYFHGGGYAFYPQSHENLIALVTEAAKSNTFALDYRLAPEHRFPSQLEEALEAYRWLVEDGISPERLVVAGDSAGGNLTLGLLLRLRDLSLPLPALGVALSPPTDFDDNRPSLLENEPYDWIGPEMLLQWSDWFCKPSEHKDPCLSPLYANLRGLPPIYVQAGRAELLYDGIQAFAERAAQQGANVMFESWADMNHDFQMYGYRAPQSAAALKRIGEVIASQMLQPAKTL